MTAGTDQRARSWAMGCHLAALSAFLGIPFGQILGPLIIWLMKRADYPFIDEQGKAAVNFQISLTIYGFCAGLLVFLVIGIPILIGLVVFDVVMIIKAAVCANKGEPVHYPLSLRLIK